MRWLVVAGIGAVLTAVGCRPTVPSRSADPPSASIRFEEIAARSGIDFSLGHGARSPLTILETAGGGAAFLDFDGDGKPDALLVGPHRVGLYRNLGGGQFQEVSSASGIDPRGYWMGCTTGDYDGDGQVDVLLTGYGRTALYRNRGGGRFEETTRAAGLNIPGWSLSGAFADYDGDGRLDLYVTRYVRFDPSTPQLCQLGNIRSACGPEAYDPQVGMLYRNLGGGRFEDVTRRTGLNQAHGKGWAALFTDVDGSGYPSLYVANDMMPADFFLNRRGRFTSKGAHAGVAYDATGHVQGAMGIDSGDYDNDGRLDILVTTYFAQSDSLYHNDGGDFFSEVGTPAGIGAPTMPYVGFGAGFLDADNDGWPDIFIANGHVRDDIRQHDPAQDYAQPLQMFRNERGQFREVSQDAGPAFASRFVGRGASFADIDGDGRVDVLVANLEGKALLLRNVSPAPNHWLQVRLRGAGGNRQGLGALVTIQRPGGRQIREIRTSGSVMSALEPVAHFGLGADTTVDRVSVRWPDGRITTRDHVPADETIEMPAPVG